MAGVLAPGAQLDFLIQKSVILDRDWAVAARILRDLLRFLRGAIAKSRRVLGFNVHKIGRGVHPKFGDGAAGRILAKSAR
jgi:hypothetical protein